MSIDDVEKGKPEPDIFLFASQKLGVAPQDCIVYEDSDGGWEAACRAGMRSKERLWALMDLSLYVRS